MNAWLLQDRTDGVLEVQLFMRQARAASFRRYTLVAENGVAVKRQSVTLIRSTNYSTRFFLLIIIISISVLPVAAW